MHCSIHDFSFVKKKDSSNENHLKLPYYSFCSLQLSFLKPFHYKDDFVLRYESVHIDDPVTRMRVFPEDVKKSRSRATSLLLLALKRSLGINLLGFFLTSGGGRNNRDLSYAMSRYPTEEDYAIFRKEKFIIETETAYDELYIINTKGLEIDEVDHMGSVQAGSSKAEIRKALKKNTKGKLQNRILLNAFIEKVA